MSLTYSGLSNYGKTTLPSVENWGANMYIVKDPPKSIHTRKIEKVSDTNFILNQEADSADRVSECISVFARGVNPFVSVNYSNQGNNTQGGGSLVGNTLGAGGQSYLPYRIMKDGAFRYPQKNKEELLPLSRQARQTTAAFTQAGFADYTKKLMCPEEDYREVKKEVLKAEIRPTATYNIGTPTVEPFEVKYVIKNPVKFDSQAGNTGVRTRDLTTTVVQEPLKNIQNTLNVKANTVKGSNTHTYTTDLSHFNTTKYIQENPLHASAQTQKSRNIQITPIDEIFNTEQFVDMYTKTALNTSYDTVKTGFTKEVSIHNDMELQRRVISTSASTNKGENIYIRNQHEHQKEQKNNRPMTNASTNYGTTSIQQGFELNSRDAKLHPTLSLGQFEGKAQKPLVNQNSDFKINNTERQIRSQKILEMQMERR